MVACGKCGLEVEKLAHGNECVLCYNERMAAYMNQRYHTRRAEAIVMLGGVCVVCTSTEQLEFDHIDEASKAINISKLFSRGKQRYLDELEKCQLLCKTCHQKKSNRYMSVPHGGGITGKKNCYCEQCAPLKRNYQREFKRRARMIS